VAGAKNDSKINVKRSQFQGFSVAIYFAALLISRQVLDETANSCTGESGMIYTHLETQFSLCIVDLTPRIAF